MKPEIKKLLILNLPYLLFVWLFDKVGAAVRLSLGADASAKLLHLGDGFTAAFSSIAPSFHPVDLLIGIAGAVIVRLIIYVKGKNAKKYRKGMEYGSARWGTAEDIKPYTDPVFENNIPLTQTERLTMNSRPKQPKYARNKNILVIGGSGSGKTRFFVKPSLMQMHSSYVVTDPKGTVLIECGKLLQRGGYRIKVLNTINFKKSMKYNPFAYLRSEKDILKLVNTIIANTKGDGEKSGEDFWVKAEKLYYTALIGYIWYEAPDEEKNFTTLLEMINASEAREDDEDFQNPVDLMFERLEEKDPEHFAVKQYKKYKLAAGVVCSKRLLNQAVGKSLRTHNLKPKKGAQVMRKNEKITALYERLSRDDFGKDDDQQRESNSISNQKLILQKYADEHHFFNTRFFVDDGFSGVSFEREGLQAMLHEVEAGNVATVITKDLSRLGRNYLKTGELIEIVFPEYEVRYIAINDGVDTAREDNEFTPLRNWFNEFYARDTSKKIRAVKQAKAQKGERVNGEVPYGYIADPNDRNHLLPDPETAHIVKQIFAMYVRGDRICEIQNWLREHEVLTVSELRYRRSGSCRHPRPHPTCIYNWPDKTLYDILGRKEYLGHTITGKSYKVSYKSKKTKKNPEEKQYFFPNTHEPLIDEETFDLAQKRIATKHRPTKVDEIDIFSGLLFCGDCGYKMYLQQGAGTLERKHAYTCGKYRNRIRTGELCTTHYIRKSVLKELVLADLQRVLSYVKEHEQEFIETANECSAKAVQKTLTQQRKELDKAQSRISELNILFRKLYEDNALGKLSDEQFAFLTSGYDEEKKTLTRRIAELSQEIDNATERSADVKRFVALVRRYTAITELTYENVHEFIDRILIHELDKETNTRKIEIFYSFVGRVDTGDKPTESISYFRQIGADVKSYAI